MSDGTTTMPIYRNQRVRLADHRLGTVLQSGATALGDEVVIQLDHSPAPRTFLRSAIDSTYDQRFPLFGVRDIGGLLIFCTLEPKASLDDPEERRMREAGLHWYRCYSGLVPDGECGHVHRDQLMEMTAEQFEGARRSGWTRLPPIDFGQGGVNL
jgi:hypothetical protein